jgi:hypothetical protein
MIMLRRIALLASTSCLLSFLPHCGATATDEGVTAIRIIPTFDDGWSLTQLALESGDHTSTVPDEPTRLSSRDSVLVLLRDDVAGHSTDLAVWGIADGKRVARGNVTFTPTLHASIDVPVELTLVAACTAWCSPGARVCDGDGVKECVTGTGGDEACPSWAPATPCPADAPYCSTGKCSARCVDECAQGDTQCAGSGAVQRCGQADSDSCLDWMPEERCAGGETCNGGACSAAPCSDECASGESQCSNGGKSTCGQFDADSCLEWGPPEACPTGESCSSGACSATCSDECSGDTCTGSTWKQCGQYDLDACLELSSGTACGATDACHVGSCSAAGGCATTAIVCDTPPAAVCTSATSRRVYGATGTCGSGGCTYDYADGACPAPSNATASCSAGFCGFTCDAGYQRSGNVCVPSAAWTVQPSGTTQSLHGVGGADGKVWAVGYGTANVVLTRSGSSWTQATVPSWPFAVWASSSADVFVVGAQVFHSSGAGWATQAAQNQGRYGVWGTSATNVYAVGSAGAIDRTTGSGTWTSQSSGTGNILNAVWGSSATDVYVVGRQGTILHSTGTGVWTSQTSSTSDDLYAVWGSSATDIYVVGWGGRIMHSHGGGTWTSQNPTNHSFYGVWGSGPSDVYAVGSEGMIYHSTGDDVWMLESSGTTQSLNAIWGASATDVTAVGDNGTILHR